MKAVPGFLAFNNQPKHAVGGCLGERSAEIYDIETFGVSCGIWMSAWDKSAFPVVMYGRREVIGVKMSMTPGLSLEDSKIH